MLSITSVQLARSKSQPSTAPLQIGLGRLRVEALTDTVDVFVEERRLDGSMPFDAPKDWLLRFGRGGNESAEATTGRRKNWRIDL